MKPKNTKKSKPNIHTVFHLTEEACTALSNALLFLLIHKDFSFDQQKISYDSASNAQEKLFDGITDLTRGEVRATAKAIDLVLSDFVPSPSTFSYMDDDMPELCADLLAGISVLADLQPLFQQTVRNLNKNK